jgi:hypothetical protein
MSLVYPSDLPCPSRIEGYSAAVSAGLVRTPMEAGNTRQRRAQRVLPHQIALVFVMPQDKLADWLTWVNAYAFDNFFTMNLPGLLAGRHGGDTVATPVRFMSDIALQLRPVHRLWYWNAQVSAEWLPLAADLAPMPWFVGAGPDTVPAVADWIIGGKPATPSADTFTAGRPATPSAIV